MSGSSAATSAKRSAASIAAAQVKKTQFNTLDYIHEARAPSRHGKPEKPMLEALVKPHVESFNNIFDRRDANGVRVGPGLLESSVKNIPKMVVFQRRRTDHGTSIEPLGQRLTMWYDSIQVGKPSLENRKGAASIALYPVECRERQVTYKARINAKIMYQIDSEPPRVIDRSFGSLPIMVKSTRCHLNGLSPNELIEKHEDPTEFGGFFLVNGIERLIRLLIVQRRNAPMAIIRPSFQKRGPTYTHYGVMIRSVRDDESAQSLTLHYLSDGAVTLRFIYNKSEYMVPLLLVLKALAYRSDREVFQAVTMVESDNTFVTDRAELMLRNFKEDYSIRTQQEALEFIGTRFAVMLDTPEDMPAAEIGQAFLDRVILVHLTKGVDKYNMLIHMLQKLYAVASGECSPDNPDSPQHQEILLGGHLYVSYLKEKMVDWLEGVRTQVLIDQRRSVAVDFYDAKYLARTFSKSPSDLGKKMEYFLATGNLVSRTGLDLQQAAGYTVVAEKLNFYRYLSHYRSVHRGSFFAELKTTTVRKLLPESWGFLCPVHTPDGSPCGLLNHLSHTCHIVTEHVPADGLGELVASAMALQEQRRRRLLSIQINGRCVAWAPAHVVAEIVASLRHYRVTRQHGVPANLEIGYVPPSTGGQYPGLFLSTTMCRMTRPVKSLLLKEQLDWVSPFEQVYMDIACTTEDIVPGITTHMEVSPTHILSVVANLTPFSDQNQSPRNMYQCQMGKQTMGTPAQNLAHRADNKLYRIQSGQTPIVRPNDMHANFGMDNYPNGTNAVVCVISYTGYDMEDASIINKSAYERGYGYGTVYKGEWVDLSDLRRRGEPVSHYFGLTLENEETPALDAETLAKALQTIDLDGLPKVGVRMEQGDVMCAYTDDVTGKVTLKAYKSAEAGIVDEVRVCGGDTPGEPLQKIHIKFRIPRAPLIGDKFSSRHGQKGVLSQRWPAVDMPFSESGIQPDVIINPHAFPSRMTIGMFVESLAGKAGALHGYAQDATPFRFSEDYPAADHFGEQLRAAGFNYHGNEPMYSGITGEEFKADIYIGVVYYQRLRHMVSDKYQVRTTGPVHNLTQQPIKGRKRAGGIRFGEMERDSLLAHEI
ncbi:beta and beta-prime subunits of DNA dependent RNA-polymerase, partial [Caulochytrium protostelioides]